MYPLFRDDERYLDMLGNPGSNPLELFWDAVDVLDQKLDAKVSVVEDAIKRHNAKLSGPEEDKADDAMDVAHKSFSVTPETTWAEFAGVVNMEVDSALEVLSDEELRLVFKTVSFTKSKCISLLTKCDYSSTIMHSRSRPKRSEEMNESSAIYKMTCATL